MKKCWMLGISGREEWFIEEKKQMDEKQQGRVANKGPGAAVRNPGNRLKALEKKIFGQPKQTERE